MSFDELCIVTKRDVLSFTGIVLLAVTVLADAIDTTAATSTDTVNRIGIFSPIACPIMYYSKEIAIFVAVFSLIELWVFGMFAKLSRKVDGDINVKEVLKTGL